jgi:hypothetical protein
MISMAKIAFLDSQKVNPRALLHSVAEHADLDGVLLVVRRGDGGWNTCWSSGITMGGLCMASMKLDYDVKQFMHDGCTVDDAPDKAS